MDRRDALKKLGMGGATVVGASLVVSSPALASTVNPVSPTVTVTTDNSEKVASFRAAQPNPTCGGSPTGLPTRTSTFSASAATPGTPARTATFSPSSGTVPLTAPTPPAATTTLSFATSSPKFLQGDTASIVITTTFSCPFAGGPATTCVRYTFGFTYNDTAKNFQLNSGSPSTSACP